MKPINQVKQTKEKYEYIFDFEKKIIVEKLHGEVRIEDILKMLQNVFFDKRYSDKFNIIVDVYDSTPIFQPYELRKVMEFLIKNKNYLKNNKIAFITNKPRHVVDSHISYDLAISLGLNITFKPFSTYEAAYKWFSIKGA